MSSEQPVKRSLEEDPETETGGEAKKANTADDLAVKVLVSNGDAGAVIGKGGATINGIKEESAANVKMSQSGDFFPGTGDRVVLISGTSDALYNALSLVVAKIAPKTEQEGTDPSFTLKLPVPNAAAGGIIGKGGSNIRSISETSGAKVQLSQKDEMHPELNERICSMTGESVQVLAAARQILDVICGIDARYTNLSTNYGHAAQQQPMVGGVRGMPGFGMVPMGYGAAMQHFGRQQMMQQQMGGMTQAAPEGASTTMTMQVPDSLVGAIVGKGGATIQLMQQQAGCKIGVSQRDGSGNPRTVTISGDPTAVANAQLMVSTKISEASLQGGQ
jgi:RNA-binding protein Nova